MAEDNNSLTKSNSRPSAEERRKDLQVFSGVRQVKQKQDGFFTWVARMFFSGRKPKDILMDVLKYDAIPAVQDGLYNSIVSFTGKMIFKEDQKPSNGSGNFAPGSFITNYVAFSDKKKQQNANALAENKKKEEETISSGYETPAFTSKDAAVNFLRSMHAYVTKYPTLSVQDLAWMQKKNIDYTWDKWGWYSDEILAIKGPTRFQTPMVMEDGNGNRIKLTHFIDLPKAHEFE